MNFLDGFHNSTFAENMVMSSTVMTNEHTHVFDHTNDREIHFFEHLYPFLGIKQGHILWSRNNDRSINMSILNHRKLNITGPRWKIDEKEISSFPINIKKKLI